MRFVISQEIHFMIKVGTHKGTCFRDMSRETISCAVHTKGHVAGIGFLKYSHGWSCAGTCCDFVF